MAAVSALSVSLWVVREGGRVACDVSEKVIMRVAYDTCMYC